MKINSNILLDALKTVRPAISQRPVIPILANFKIDGDKVIATNLNITIIAHVDELTTEPITLPYAEVLSICSSVKGELDVTPELIECGETKYDLPEPYDISTFPEYKPLKGLDVDVPENIIVALKKAASCTMKPDTNTNACNVFFESDGNVITVKSTDGNIAFIQKFENKSKNFSLLLQPEAINALEIDEYKCTISENRIEFKNGFMTIQCSLVEGSVMPIEQWYEKKREKSFTFNKHELIDCINMVNVFNILPIVTFAFDSEGVTLSIHNEGSREGAKSKIQAPNEFDLSFNVNATFLNKALKIFSEKQEFVTLSIQDEKSGILFTGTSSAPKIVLSTISK